jgi:hypothetical protein
MTSFPVKRPHLGGYCTTSGCACVHPSKLENDKVIGRGRPREHTRALPLTWLPVPVEALRVTFDDVISGQKDPVGRILRNFRLPMRTPFQESSFGVTWPSVTSVSHVGHAQWFILYYYYSKKKSRELVLHVHAITSVTSGHATDVTSGQSCFRSLPLPVSPPWRSPEMRLCPCWYTTEN